MLTDEQCPRDEAKYVASSPARKPEADPDYGKLRAYRSYFALRRIDHYAHHFDIYYHCVETSVEHYAVYDDGRVEPQGGAWGGLAGWPPRSNEIPPELKQAAERARAAFARTRRGGYEGQPVYRGSYREVVIDEIVPLDGLVDPYARSVNALSVTLKADRTLGALQTAPATLQGGTTFMCWRDISYGDCSKPWWIDFTPTASGGAFLWPFIIDHRQPGTDPRYSEFEQALLAAARAREAGQVDGTPLDRLLAKQEDSLLPARFAPPLGVAFTLYARPKRDGVQQQEAELRIKLAPTEAVFGQARGSASATVGGVTVHGSVVVSAVRPPPRDAIGTSDMAFRLWYELRDARGTLKRADIPIQGTVLLDRGSVVMKELKLPAGLYGSHDPPGSQTFPGEGRFAQVDTYVAIVPRVVDSWR